MLAATVGYHAYLLMTVSRIQFIIIIVIIIIIN